MGKRKKLKKFILQTKDIDYNNLEQIISTFNQSINSYNRFKEVLEGGDDLLASEKLRDAANKLYNVCEWSFKKYLYNKYKELESKNIINKNECFTSCRKLNSHECTLKYLIDEINNLTENKAKLQEIDFNTVLKNASKVNNGPKHSCKVPDVDKYLHSALEIRNFIKSYLDENADLKNTGSIADMEDDWYEFQENCDNFLDVNSYILITGSMTGMNKELVKNIFKIQWDMIFDFDISSEENGLANLYKELTGVNPVIRDLSRTNVIKPINSISTPYWVMAGGYVDDENSISDDKNWRIKYGRNLPDFLDKFHSIYTKPAKIIICYYNHEKIIKKIVEDFNVAYNNGEDIDFIALSNDIDFEIIDEENFNVYSVSLECMLKKLNNEFSSKSEKMLDNRILIPTKDDVIEIDYDFFNRLQDSFEVVYKGIENSEVGDLIKDNAENFYKGICELSWIGAKKHFDINRNKLIKVKEKIKTNFNDRGRIIKALKYSPGVGGTTFMRRLAWEMHDEFPVLILKNYISSHTSKNVEKLFNKCKIPILILADSNDIFAIDAFKLYTELKALSLPFEIYYIERTNTVNNKSDVINSYERLLVLKDEEIKDMQSTLKLYITEQQCLEKIDDIQNVTSDLTPFIMSMYAFDKEFKGIKSYISNFLKVANDEFKKILSYIALADYANQKIDIQFFEELFENEDIEKFIFGDNSAFNDLVVVINSLSGKKYFKIKYHLFAKEILIQLSSGEKGEKIEFSSLLNYIISFIEDSRKNPYYYNHDTIELLRVLFITRVEDEDSMKPAFSPLIEQLKQECKLKRLSDSQANDIIAKIFKKLVEIYPEEPHFLAHLARYYFYIDENYEKGFEIIDEAISISNSLSDNDRKDSLLYHMKAMGYSSRITNKYLKDAKKYHKNDQIDDMNKCIELIKNDARQALELFSEVRLIGHNIAGYVSDINMCIHISEFGKYVSSCSDFKEFCKDSKNNWYIKLIDNAYTLFEECKKISHESENIKILEIGQNLQQLVGKLDDSIEYLERYLQKSIGNQAPIIRRMLARAYQSKNIDSKSINQSEINRIVQLMEENIYEEPKKSGNIRIWFNAIRKQKSDNPEIILDDAIIKLNSWVMLTGEIDAYYYRFILKFIKAVEGSVAAQRELYKLLRELKSQAEHLPNKTTIYEWFGNEGEGIERIISSKNFHNNSDEELKNKLYILNGRISDNYVNDNHAYINVFGIDVFFNPSATGGEVDKSKTKQKVKFGLGFSYDGPRVFNSSINFNFENDEDNSYEVMGKLESGSIVKCEVFKNVDHFVKVRILGFECEGSIHTDNLKKSYSKDKRPKIGAVLEVQVLNSQYDSKTNKKIWNLTMNIKDSLNDQSQLTTFQKQLLNMKNNMNNNN